VEEELSLLVTHGFLHLLGYDHETDDGEMRRLEKDLLARAARVFLNRRRLPWAGRRTRRRCPVGELDEGPAIAEPPDAGVIAEASRCGFVALIGRANVGKSTLMNRLVGSKLSIVSEVPQTTRFPVRGILHRPGLQVVFIDTPGSTSRATA